jgi:hypothetical protein
LSGCTKLQHIIIPPTVELIKDLAFRGYPKLTTVQLGNGLEEIEQMMFDACTSLQPITTPPTIGPMWPSG